MTYILAIDTTLGACSAAILTNNGIADHIMEVRARGHVERLLPMIDELIERNCLELDDVGHIAVTIGPGTFAGVRIGLSAAKGMSLALDVKLIPVTTLVAIAYEYAQNNKAFKGEIAVAIDARRGEVYVQSFKLEHGLIKVITEPEAVALIVAVGKLVPNVSVIIGSGAQLLEGKVDKNIDIIIEGYVQPNSAYIVRYAAENLMAEKEGGDVSPLYLRAPDAVMPKPSKMIVLDD